MDKYWYQVTEWVDELEELSSARKLFHKYEDDYVIKRNEKEKLAIFTVGKLETPLLSQVRRASKYEIVQCSSWQEEEQEQEQRA